MVRGFGAGACFAALALLRADGFGLLLSVVAGVIASGAGRRLGARSWLSLAGLPTFAVLAQHGFRYAYYGEWVPNTAAHGARGSGG
jgi:hypothetical protein